MYYMCIVSNQLAVTNTKCPSVKNRILSDSLMGKKLMMAVLYVYCFKSVGSYKHKLSRIEY